MKQTAFIMVALGVLFTLSACDMLSSDEFIVQIKSSVSVGKPPLILTFRAEVPEDAVEPISYQWHFGDGESSLGHPTTHRYIASGNYRVNLIITDAVGKTGRVEKVIKVIDFSQNSHPTQNGSGAIASADFDGNGIPDLAVNNRIQGDVSIFLGQSNGDYVHSRTIGNGGNFSDIVTGDFDEDGLEDIAVADLVNSVILIFASNGRGAFKDPTSAPIFRDNFLVATGPLTLDTGDFNGDGALDVVTANQDTDNVSVLFGDGEGRLNLARVFKPHQIGEVVQAKAANVDHDNLDDLIVLNQTSGQAEVYLGRGDGTFILQMEVSASVFPTDLIAEDLDQDGNVDIAISNAGSNDVSLWWGRSNGRFDNPGRWDAGGPADRIAAADIDGDGHLDLLTLDRQGGKVNVILAQATRFSLSSSRAFEHPINFTVGSSLDSLGVKDLNNDGQTDLMISETAGQVDLLLNLTPKP